MERKLVFSITYKVYFKDKNKSVEEHETKTKNCMSELHAKISLGEHLKKKYIDMDYFVITNCKEEIKNPFADLLGDSVFKGNSFNDMFGKNNPFNDIFGGFNK